MLLQQTEKNRWSISLIRALAVPHLLLFFLLAVGNSRAFGQRDSAAVLAFTKGYDLVGITGPGWTSGTGSGDMILELCSNCNAEESADFEKLVLLRAQTGKYQQIAENEGLLMAPSMLGASGSTSIYFVDSTLYVDYALGSSSSFSKVSISFRKNKQGEYLFRQYHSTTSHYDQEDLFARTLITASSSHPLSFCQATEQRIVNCNGDKEVARNADTRSELIAKGAIDISISAAAKKFKTHIPSGYQLLSSAMGDLNGDSLTHDALLLLQLDEKVVLRLLLENKDGTYQLQAENDQLLAPFYPTEGRPVQNIRLVIKNTYFTIEQRIPICEMDYEHRYLSFHFNQDLRRFLLHRYDVEQYAGFQTRPKSVMTQRYNKDFGILYFAALAAPPNTFIYGEPNTVLTGIIKQKKSKASGADTSNKNAFTVTLLQLPHCISVQPPPYRKQSALPGSKQRGLETVQLLTENRSIELHEFLEKKVRVKGTFLPGASKSHTTPVVFVVQGIEAN